MFRSDYLVRLAEEIGRFVAETIRLRESGRHNEALLQLIHAQEKLLARPMAELDTLPLGAQLDALTRGESPENAAQKCLTYADLLAETARVYDGNRETDAAASAREAALVVLLESSQRHPGLVTAETGSRINQLRAQLDPAGLHKPTRELLAAFDQSH